MMQLENCIFHREEMVKGQCLEVCEYYGVYIDWYMCKKSCRHKLTLKDARKIVNERAKE